MAGVRLTVRIDFGSTARSAPARFGFWRPSIKTGSISQAGRSLGMSYRRAWLLVDDLNHCFRQPVVDDQARRRARRRRGADPVRARADQEISRD